MIFAAPDKFQLIETRYSHFKRAFTTKSTSPVGHNAFKDLSRHSYNAIKIPKKKPAP